MTDNTTWHRNPMRDYTETKGGHWIVYSGDYWNNVACEGIKRGVCACAYEIKRNRYVTRIMFIWTLFWKNSQSCGPTSSQTFPIFCNLSSSSKVVLAWRKHTHTHLIHMHCQRHSACVKGTLTGLEGWTITKQLTQQCSSSLKQKHLSRWENISVALTIFNQINASLVRKRDFFKTFKKSDQP